MSINVFQVYTRYHLILGLFLTKNKLTKTFNDQNFKQLFSFNFFF